MVFSGGKTFVFILHIYIKIFRMSKYLHTNSFCCFSREYYLAMFFSTVTFLTKKLILFSCIINQCLTLEGNKVNRKYEIYFFSFITNCEMIKLGKRVEKTIYYKKVLGYYYIDFNIQYFIFYSFFKF